MKKLAIFLIITFFTVSFAFAVVSPKEQIKKTVDNVISILKDPKYKGQKKAQQRRAALRAEISKVFDFEEMAKRSLGVYWKDRTPQERKEFVELYKDLLERSYSGKIESYTDEEVIYTDEKIENGKFAEVKTKIITKERKEIPINYRLYFNGNEWKVYDVVIEGVSLVSNYRSQFNKIIRTYSYQELVKRMKTKQLEELMREK
ncbi:phospholipid transport system substrate-binding protein [Thermodesulfovibrio aggregans]|uniref:Phospholipid transport system substrate-binding protein n=1 Tax=Thermodesulfovibrio aggregans TaxID=86166 RepID=A0A0U9HVQ4_9BACT|nr:ABC transporter substrate-binding protein [Thermodesulfovibrio aggregans]GAQ94977.1 phospholipid transport system substrate-binding protein [Thermodesulfovibrio aggregans]